jgi:outer membrane protein OmpA-like peptidoglycan-associated protein
MGSIRITAWLAGGLLPALLAAQGPRVPFARNLQLTWASSLGGEPDFETVITVLQVDSGEARLRVSWNRGAERRWQAVEGKLSSRERRLARSLYFYASSSDPREFRGSTQSMVSAAIHGELSRTGKANVVLLMPGVSNVPYRGTLQRVGTGTEPFPVLLDGRPVTVRGLRARGTLTGDRTTEFEVLMLDDPEVAWVLEATSSGGEKLKGGRRLLVRIATQAGEAAVASTLEKDCVVSVHDIDFASGSAALDSTSAPALSGIAATLGQHGDWRITIVGHTDSIGTAAANLDLSRRRAERVRSTLAGQYGIAADRLKAEGRGETAPIDDNGTLFGRARNRRVDLVRPCPGKTP